MQQKRSRIPATPNPMKRLIDLIIISMHLSCQLLKSLDKFVNDSSYTHSLILRLPSDPFVCLPADPPAYRHCIGHLLATGSRSCPSVIHPSHTNEAVSFQMSTAGITKLEL